MLQQLPVEPMDYPNFDVLANDALPVIGEFTKYALPTTESGQPACHEGTKQETFCGSKYDANDWRRFVVGFLSADTLMVGIDAMDACCILALRLVQ